MYLEVTSTDADGNVITRPAATGFETRARIWPLSSTEKQDSGFQSSTSFGMRFPRSFTFVLEAQAQIGWNGKRYSVVGDPLVWNGSARTRRAHYVIERS